MLRRWIVTLSALLMSASLFSMTNYAQIYPPTLQELVDCVKFYGDRHGQFAGDEVAVLSDGSGWKVHPSCLATYRKWHLGDVVRIDLRPKDYWFKCEHKFLLRNITRGEDVKVMLVLHKEIPLRIVATEVYYKSSSPQWHPYTTTTYDAYGNVRKHTDWHFAGFAPSQPRKVVILSDGSSWVIKSGFNDFQVGMEVYVGAQGSSEPYYDFILISGTEREATYTLARPQRI